MKRILFALAAAGAVLGVIPARAQFTGGNLMVLRIGNIITNSPSKQGPLFVDQFSPAAFNSAPSYTVAVPTNGSGSLILNGQAATEGALARSADHAQVLLIGYAATLGSISGTPGTSTGPRGIATISAAGTYTLVESSTGLFGGSLKTNPRGLAGDGTNNFWAGGGGGGTLYVAGAGAPVAINDQVDNLRGVKLINGSVYLSSQNPAGIFLLADAGGHALAYPESAALTNLVFATSGGGTAGFDMNPGTNICYVADTALGIQKYTNNAGVWHLAYTFGIGNPANANTGCFAVAADFSGASPVVYATTMETNGAGNVSTNRLIRIVDTNSTATVTTLAIAPANYNFKGLDFSPDLRPIILTGPVSQTVNAGATVQFSVTASAPSAITYQWLENGTNLSGQNSATLTLANVDTSLSGSTFACVLADSLAAGSVTSAVATLTVDAVAAPPVITQAPASATNYIGDTVVFSFAATGTTPMTNQWQFDDQDLPGQTGPNLVLTNISITNAGNYRVHVSNSDGATNSAEAALTVLYVPVNITSQPAALSLLAGQSGSLSVTATGTQPAYQWYADSGVALTNGGDFSGVTTATLTITNAQVADFGFYYVAVGNPAGTNNSATVELAVYNPRAPSWIRYQSEGSIYSQDFDTLPDPGTNSVGADNPVTIAGVKYSLANPIDFSFPALTSGGDGGLGAYGLTGWYGWVQEAGFNRFGANCGDSTTGGIMSFGLTNSVAAATNRAVGLISTGSTGEDAFAALFINNTSNTLAYVTLGYTGEVWRQSDVAKTLQFSYIIDPAGTNSTLTNAMTLAGATVFLPALDVNIPTIPADTGGVAVDGTQGSNQVALAVTNQVITNWPPGAALWLVWEYTTTTGKAQGLAIDNLTFAASSQPLTFGAPTLSIQAVGTNVVLSWPSSPIGYNPQQNASLTDALGWYWVSGSGVTANGTNSVTIPASASAQYFRLSRALPGPAIAQPQNGNPNPPPPPIPLRG